MPEANAGPAMDLRDENVQRTAYLSMLMDWNGSDLLRIYEPISQQLGFVFLAFVVVMVAYTAWNKARQWSEEGRVRWVGLGGSPLFFIAVV